MCRMSGSDIAWRLNLNPYSTALKALLKKHERTLKVLKDEPQEYTLVTKSNSNRGQPMWFGSVRALAKPT